MSRSSRFASRQIWCSDALRFRKVLNESKGQKAEQKMAAVKEGEKNERPT